ncbi:MAG: DNA methyltransferase, partial [Limisphaerales bacterium]
AYLAMMAARLLELRRVLKPSGSLYIHCDPTASHYLKILLDAIFGHLEFRNEIIWKRTSGHSDARRYGSVHDSILFFTRTGEDQHVWNQIHQAYEPAYIHQYYRYEDTDGRRFMSGDIGAAGLQGGGYDYVWKGVRRVWRVPVATMKQLDAENRIFYTRNGIPRIKRYLDESKGLPCQDIWTDIEALRSWHQERLRYPTQKPVALLERIINASSNPDDVILDPFCGCGTSVEAAEKTGRQWIGIDVTHYAVSLIERRLNKMNVPKGAYSVVGRPTTLKDAHALARRDKHQFQWWAAWLLGAQTYREAKRGPDGGIDGNIFFQNGPYGTGRIIISVKGGDNVGIGMIRELSAVVTEQEAEMGILILLAPPTEPMKAFATAAGFVQKSAHGRLRRLQIITIDELLSDIKPKLPPLPQIEFRPAQEKWSRLSEQIFRVDKWSVCRV